MKEFFDKKTIGFIVVGISLGLSIGLGFSAFASKKVNSNSLPILEINRFASALNRVKDVYVDEVADKKLINSAISGMISKLDPHSVYLEENAYKEMKIDTRGEFGGLGIEVQMENGLIKVVAPIEDTPAERAGIKSGDLIFQINKKPVRGQTLTEAVKKMRGKPGTSIMLSIRRAGVSEPFEVTIIREIIKINSVRTKMLPNNIGFIRITSFQENTTPLLVKKIIDLYKSGSIDSVILDLRNDPGGLLSTAISVASIFLPENQTVVTTNGRTPDSNRSYSTHNRLFKRHIPKKTKFPLEHIKKVPMVVLINGGSASASEIIAGAFQDYQRGKIMGLQSFGKASVQTIIPLEDHLTAIKITTARYYTPNGRSIQVTGIVPDLWVAETKDGHVRRQLREQDFPGHLDNDKDDGNGLEIKDIKDVIDQPVNNKPKFPKFGSEDDWMLKQAINYLTDKKIATIPPKNGKKKEN